MQNTNTPFSRSEIEDMFITRLTTAGPPPVPASFQLEQNELDRMILGSWEAERLVRETLRKREMAGYKHFSLNDVTAELLEDALKVGSYKGESWTKRMSYDSPSRYPRKYEIYNMEYIAPVITYEVMGYWIEITDDKLTFQNDNEFIDTTIDLNTDGEKLMELIDWFYEGGDCPLLKPFIDYPAFRLFTKKYDTSE